MADLDLLAERSKQLTVMLGVALATALTAQEKMIDAEEAWNNRYFEWCTDYESATEAPGGRWNDQKRKYAAMNIFDKAYSTMRETKRAYLIAENEIKVVNADISGLNRLLRLLELAQGGTNLSA